MVLQLTLVSGYHMLDTYHSTLGLPQSVSRALARLMFRVWEEQGI